ncbi:hypothetical protein HYU95_04425 [Candidatus Daviesbacteria bacterium]|nr:hypothetical protein [Candidatus Daviesbacteria bacterium]
MEKFRKYLSDSSSVSLLITNFIVIVLAIIQKWDISTVLWVYWMQSIIIGFFQFLRILSLRKFSTENFTINNKSVSSTVQTKLFAAFFFIFHYGFFHFLYAIFLFNFFTSQSFDLTHLFLGGLIFFINHFFSYQHNKMIDQQKTLPAGRQVQNIGHLMFSPYARIVPMHLIVIFGAILGQSALIIFLLLKTVSDLLMHTIKHKMSDS